MTRSPASRAATTSGLPARTALETTTVWAPATLDAACPTVTVAPSARRAVRIRESFASLPLTGRPRASSTRAIPDMPAPPMPTKCT